MVIYRLLTPHSVEMEMMKKQLSKRKLERLAIQGGDFRKAGKRESRDFSLDDLRHLLADDVDLSRKTDGAGERESEGSALRDISEAELDLVMSRELLFGSGSGSGSGSGGDRKHTRTRSHSLTRTRSEKRASRSLARSGSGSVSESGSDSESGSVRGSVSGSESESEAEDFDGDLSVASQCAVPAEGEMYDIVHSDAAGMLSAIE